MTAYCFVDSPGFSNSTFILGALPLGAASDGATYSLSFSCECPIRPAIPINININAQPERFMLLTAFALPFSRIFTIGLSPLASPLKGCSIPLTPNAEGVPLSAGGRDFLALPLRTADDAAEVHALEL